MTGLFFFIIILLLIGIILLFLIKFQTADAGDKTDIYLPSGYHKNFKTWSKQYRNFRNYTCESCHIRLVGKDRYYLHTHHIDGNKANNHPRNFKALCIYCHAQQPGKGHRKLKYSPDYYVFVTRIMPKYLQAAQQNNLLKHHFLTFLHK